MRGTGRTRWSCAGENRGAPEAFLIPQPDQNENPTGGSQATAGALIERIRSFAMPEGALRCREIRMRQTGEIRLRPDRPWLRLRAEENFAAERLDFRWRGRVRIAKVLQFSVEDGFQAGHGLLGIKLFGVLPLSRFRGPNLDRGEALRGLAEMPWRPWGFAERQPLAWTTRGDGKLLCRYDDGATRCTVEFEVDAEGRVLACRAPDRPRTVQNESVDTPWSGAFHDYAAFGGVRVPTRAEVTWHLPEGDFTYFRARVTGYRTVA